MKHYLEEQKVYFLDQDIKSIQIIKKNISKLKINDQDDIMIKIIKEEAIKALKKVNEIFDIVLMDPPYNQNITNEILENLKIII